MQRIALTAVLLAIAVPLRAAPPQADVAHNFRVSIVSDVVSKVDSVEQKVDATADVRYTWKNVGEERVLLLEMIKTKAVADGKTLLDTTMSREKMINVSEGVAKEVKAADGPEGLRKLLQAAFGQPLCKLQRDANGKEIKRTVVAQPEAKGIIENGMIANGLLFHPPYYPGKSEWESECEVGMGSGGIAKGKLRYKRLTANNFSVRGSLGNEEFKSPNGLTLKKARYEVDGSQTYDPALSEWIAGKMTIAAAYELFMGDTKIGSAKGTMNVTFQRIEPEK